MGLDILLIVKEMFHSAPCTIVFTGVAAILGTLYTIFRTRTRRNFAEEKVSGRKERLAKSPILEDMNPGRWPTDKLADEDSGDRVENTSAHGAGSDGLLDPVEFCEHIPSEMKKVQERVARKKLEAEMTASDRVAEQEIQRQQMEAIFNLLKEQEDKYGVTSMDDLDSQMKLYSQAT